MRGFSATRPHRAPNGARTGWWHPTRLESRVLYGGMFKSGGYSLALLGRRFRANPPAVIHAHYGVVAAQHRHLARSLGRPLVASFYGYDASRDQYVGTRLWRARYRRLFRDVAAVLVEGPRMAERVAALGCPAEKLHIIRLPADAAGLAGVVRRPADTFRRGRGRPVRGEEGLRHRRPGVREGLPRLRRAAAHDGRRASSRRSTGVWRGTRGSRSRSRWLGSLPFEQFMSQIASASVAVFPSRPAPDGDTEGGAPVTLIETQWLGVPALVSEHDDLPFVTAPSATEGLASDGRGCLGRRAPRPLRRPRAALRRWGRQEPPSSVRITRRKPTRRPGRGSTPSFQGSPRPWTERRRCGRSSSSSAARSSKRRRSPRSSTACAPAGSEPGRRCTASKQMLEKYVGVSNVRCVSSCTAALSLAMKILDIGPGMRCSCRP